MVSYMCCCSFLWLLNYWYRANIACIHVSQIYQSILSGISLNLFYSIFSVHMVSQLMPHSQQQWSCRDVHSILWDFYSTLGCHDTQNVLHKYNHPSDPTKPLRFICMDGLTKPHFLGRLRHERLTSNQMVGQ